MKISSLYSFISRREVDVTEKNSLFIYKEDVQNVKLPDVLLLRALQKNLKSDQCSTTRQLNAWTLGVYPGWVYRDSEAGQGAIGNLEPVKETINDLEAYQDFNRQSWTCQTLSTFFSENVNHWNKDEVSNEILREITLTTFEASKLAFC